MKKLVVMFGVLMIISRVSFAGEVNAPEPTTTRVSLKGDVVKIFYRSENSDRVKVTIYDIRSNIIFSEQIKSESSFVRPYKLKDLPYGEYTVVIEDKNGKTEEKVSYFKEEAQVMASIISKKNNRGAVVALFSKGEAEVTYRMVDSSNNVLYSETQKVNGQNTKAFNLERVQGAVTLEVSDSNGLLESKTLN